MRRNLLSIVVCLSVFFMAETALGEVLYVKPDGSDLNIGTSWEQAFKTVQKALADAVSGDEIWVAKGTYLPTTSETDPRSATFQLKTGVALYGGFSGTEQALNERDWTANETILSGDINGDDVGFTNNIENVYHVVKGKDNAKIDGFTITGGNANGSEYPDEYGGGIYNSFSDPNITNCIISGNTAIDGGGIYNYNSDPTIEHCTISGNNAEDGGGINNYYNSDPKINQTAISGNNAEYSGGGIYNYQSSPTLTECTISKNTSYYGGGIYNYYNSNPKINQSAISENNATYNGGGIGNYKSSPTLTECTISKNTSNNGGGIYNDYCDSTTEESTIEKCTISGNNADQFGGGIYNNKSPSVKITDSDITGNNAEYSGGGIYNNESNSTIERSTISENTSNNGNGIYNRKSFPTIFGCTISKNTSSGSGSGGGIYNEDSGPTITSCIISENTAGYSGGGIYNKNESDPTPTISNCIITENSAGSSGGGITNYSSSPFIANCTISGNTVNTNASGIYNYESTATITNSIVWGNNPSDVSEIYTYNPTSPLPTVTYSAVDQGGYEAPNAGNNIRQDPLLGADYHLQAGSPCINAGDPASGPPTFPAEDIDGEPRSPGKYDMGADEFYKLLGDVDGDKDVDLADAILVLKILAGITPASVNLDADVNGDGKMGIAELIFIIQTVSALR